MCIRQSIHSCTPTMGTFNRCCIHFSFLFFLILLYKYYRLLLLNRTEKYTLNRITFTVKLGSLCEAIYFMESLEFWVANKGLWWTHFYVGLRFCRKYWPNWFIVLGGYCLRKYLNWNKSTCIGICINPFGVGFCIEIANENTFSRWCRFMLTPSKWSISLFVRWKYWMRQQQQNVLK